METVAKRTEVKPRIATLGSYVAKAKSLDPRKYPTEEFELFSVPSHAEGKPEVVVGKSVGASKQIVEDDTVLLCKINPRINRVWVVSSHTAHKKVASSEWMTFPPNPDFLPHYLGYYLQQDELRDHLALNASGVGGSLMRAKPGLVKDYPFPLFPLPQQRRIVEAIELQLGRLDAAVARLHGAKAKLKRYKQAVLKAAYDEADLNLSGKKGHDGPEWLKAILAKRKALAVNAAKYSVPEAPDTEWMPELPDGWTWASLEQITHPTDVITYGVIKLGDDTPGGVPCIRSSDLKSLRLNLDTVKTIRKDIADNYKRTYLEGGEVIFAIRGTIGGVAVAPAECKGYNIAREVARIKLVDERLNQYVAICLAGPFLSAWFSTRLKGIAYTGINIEILKQAPIPIPPPHVLKAIIERTDDRLERHDNVLATLNAQLLQATRLRQAVLKRAFEGRLVGGVDAGTP